MAELKEVTVWTEEDVKQQYVSARGGMADIARILNDGNNETLNAGFAIFHNAHYELTMPKDEVIFVTKGVFSIIQGDQKHDCRPGQAIFIPRGVPLIWHSDGEAHAIFAFSLR